MCFSFCSETLHNFKLCTSAIKFRRTIDTTTARNLFFSDSVVSVLREFFNVLDGSVVNNYKTSASAHHYDDGFNVRLRFSGDGDDDDKECIRLNVRLEVAIQVTTPRAGFNVQHALPRSHATRANNAQEIVSQIREDFDLHKLPVLFITRLAPAPKTLDEIEVRRLPRKQRKTYDQIEAQLKTQRRMWLMDTSDIEERILSESLASAQFAADTNDVMALYTLLSCGDKRPLPRLPVAIKRTLLLHVMKRQKTKRASLADTMTSYCDAVLGMVRSGQCNSFLLKTLNIADGLLDLSTLQTDTIEAFIDAIRSRDLHSVQVITGIDDPARDDLDLKRLRFKDDDDDCSAVLGTTIRH